MADTTVHIISLCSGSGMLDAGLQFAMQAIGMQSRVVCYVERDSSAAGMLLAGMANETIQAAPVWCGDVQEFDAAPWRGSVDFVTGGYPCQPFSTAGKKLGRKDPRHLWPAIRRICSRVQPSIVFFENVEGHSRLGLWKVLRDLQRLGYRTSAGLFSAKESGAPHLRKRIFVIGVVANKPGERWQVDAAQNVRKTKRVAASRRADAGGCNSELADSGSGGREQDADEVLCGESITPDRMPIFPPGRNEFGRWAELVAAGLDATLMPSIEPGIPVVADGMVPSSDLLRIGGNGVVPVCAALAFLQLLCCVMEETKHRTLGVAVQGIFPGMEWEAIA